jgi:phage tail-like protein
MSGRKQYPVLGFNFTITLVEAASAGALIQASVGLPPQGGFSECTGLEVTIQPETYAEGGNNGALLKFTGRAAWSNIRLKRGVVTSADLWRWHADYIDGNGKRRDGVITLQNELGKSVRTWRFRNGLPVRWAGPALDALKAQIAIEEIEIAHEGLRQTGAGSGSLAESVVNLFS